MLTPAMQKVLNFLIAYTGEHGGMAPCIEEIRSGCGFNSRSSPHRLVGLLEREGFITRTAHRARSIRILKFPEVPKMPDRQIVDIALAATECERERCAGIAERLGEQLVRRGLLQAPKVAAEIAAAIRHSTAQTQASVAETGGAVPQ